MEMTEMNDTKGLHEDLAYVAAAVRNECPPEVRAIYLLWAVLVPVGFALPDFAPQWAGWYWLIVGPAGGVASWLIGSRASARTGIRDRQTGRRYAWHWTAAAVAFLLAALPAFKGQISGSVMGGYMLLIAGLVYVLAGVHLNRPMVYAGSLMLAGYLVINLLDFAYAWTATGIIVGLGLALTALLAGRPREQG
jgi:hypothetical protein